MANVAKLMPTRLRISEDKKPMAKSGRLPPPVNNNRFQPAKLLTNLATGFNPSHIAAKSDRNNKEA